MESRAGARGGPSRPRAAGAGDGAGEPRDYRVSILSRHDYGPAVCRLDLQAPGLAAALRPGQFVMVEVPASGRDPLLRRPLGYLGRDPEKGRLSLLVQSVGRGTEILSRLDAGGTLGVLGPLGNGWTRPERGPVLLAAGGIGIAPLFDLAVQLAPRVETVLIYGARREEDLYLRDELAKLPLALLLATDDGSAGFSGTTVDCLPRVGLPRFARWYACGPRPMLAALQKAAAGTGVPGEISLEERMACGYGACLGCAAAVRGADGPAYKRVCTEGPVFPAGEVIFDGA